MDRVLRFHDISTLISLSKRPVHVYGLFKQCRVDVAYSTYVRSVRDLCVDGLIRKSGIKGANSKRIYYEITPLGKEILDHHRKLMRTILFEIDNL